MNEEKDLLEKFEHDIISKKEYDTFLNLIKEVG